MALLKRQYRCARLNNVHKINLHRALQLTGYKTSVNPTEQLDNIINVNNQYASTARIISEHN